MPPRRVPQGLRHRPGCPDGVAVMGRPQCSRAHIPRPPRQAAAAVLKELDRREPAGEKRQHDEVGRAYEDMRAFLHSSNESFQDSATAYCTKHDQQCPVYPVIPAVQLGEPLPLVGNVAGTTCVGWSKRGTRLSGVAEHPLL